jgi:hypothetical protein
MCRKLLGALVAVTALLYAAGDMITAQPQEGESKAEQRPAPPAEKSGQKPEAPAPAAGSAAPGIAVRPANQELLDKAARQMEALLKQHDRLKAASERPAAKGASEALKNDVIEAFEAINRLYPLCDELVLRGEMDGIGIRNYTNSIRSQVEQLLTKLRGQMVGSQEGLQKRRDKLIKIQTAAVGKAEKLLTDQSFDKAYEQVTRLFREADEVGLFLDAEQRNPLYGQLFTLLNKVYPPYVGQLKRTLIGGLREEYSGLSSEARPDFAGFRKEFGRVISERRADGKFTWKGSERSGPEFLKQIADEWKALSRKTTKSLAVLHSIGAAAKDDFAALAGEYSQARAEILAEAPQIIAREPANLSEPEVEARYVGYIQNIPPLMSALRARPGDFQDAYRPLDKLAARSPALSARVTRYRMATGDYLRWQRRLTQKYLAAVRGAFPAPSLTQVLANPIAPGSKDVRFTTQSTYSLIVGAPEIAGIWNEQWAKAKIGFTVHNCVTEWLPNGEPLLISPWQQRIVVEAPAPRPLLQGFFDGLAHELLQSPQTLEAMFAVHTAAHGPYVEIGGIVSAVAGESLTDRLWDLSHPLDVDGAIDPRSATEYPESPALIRLVVQPVWIAHDYFIWSVPLPSPAEPSGTPAADAPTPSRGSDAGTTGVEVRTPPRGKPQPVKSAAPTKRRGGN